MHETVLTAASIRKLTARVRALGRRPVRDAEKCFWIEGIRQFVQACDAKYPFDTAVHSRVLLESDLAEMLVRRLAAAGVRRVHFSPEQFRKISTTPRASGIGAIVRQRWMPLASLDATRGNCLLVMEEIRSPGNLGTILRTAEACGVGGVIFVGSWCDPHDPAVVRSSMGGIFHLPLIRTSHPQLGAWAAAHNVELVGLSPEAPILWTQLQPGGPVAVVIGEERQGISGSLRALCRTMVRLPMTGFADSLNVGVAAGVMMYEMVRRGEVVQPPKFR